MNWWLPDYDASEHEVQIEQYFRIVDSGRRDMPTNRTLVICFTNRSGSNFLSHALASTGSVGTAREYLNYPMVRNQSSKQGVNSFDEYFIDLGNRFGHRGTFILKAGLRQLYYIAKLGFLGDLLTNPSFVLIERNDVIAQAVSWVVALQTGQWTSQQDLQERDPVYDFAMIHARVDGIVNENAAFRAFLARNGCDAHFVTYERLRSNPSWEISELSTALDLEHTEFNPQGIEISPQRSSIKADWKRRYLNDLKQANE